MIVKDQIQEICNKYTTDTLKIKIIEGLTYDPKSTTWNENFRDSFEIHILQTIEPIKRSVIKLQASMIPNLDDIIYNTIKDYHN